MKALYLIFVLALNSWCQLMPMQIQPEKVETATFKVDDQNIKPKTQSTKEVYTEKVYETEAQGYELVEQSFKNVVLWVYDQEESGFLQRLEDALKTLNPKENSIDIIFLKSSSKEFPEKELGIYVKHLTENYFLPQQSIQEMDGQQLFSEIKSYVAPSLQPILKAETQQYLQGEQVKLLLLMESSHQHFQLVKKQFEQQLKEGTLKEGGVSEIKHLDQALFRVFSSPSLLLYKPNAPLERYDNNITYFDQITDFIYLESLPIVVPLNAQYYARVFGGSINVKHFFQNIQTQFHLMLNEQDDNEAILKEYRGAALNNKEKDLKYERIIFTYSNFSDNKDLWTQFDFTEETQPPQLVITKTNFRKFQLEKYLYDEDEINTEKIGIFLERFRERNVTEFYRSEPIPDQPEIDGVMKVVGKTFITEIIKGRLNTLVLFWDSKNPSVSVAHEEVLRHIGKELPDDKREFLKIVTFDLALNEHPSITIDSAPQLYLYLAGDKRRPKTYNLEITVDQIKAWLSYWIMDLELVQFKPEGGYTVVDLEKYKEERRKAQELFAQRQAEMMEAMKLIESRAREILLEQIEDHNLDFLLPKPASQNGAESTEDVASDDSKEAETTDPPSTNEGQETTEDRESQTSMETDL